MLKKIVIFILFLLPLTSGAQYFETLNCDTNLDIKIYESSKIVSTEKHFRRRAQESTIIEVYTRQNIKIAELTPLNNMNLIVEPNMKKQTSITTNHATFVELSVKLSGRSFNFRCDLDF